MKVSTRDGVIFVSGEIGNDEGIEEFLRHAAAIPAPVYVDSSGLARGNSRGLYALSLALYKRNVPALIHINMSLFLGLQFALSPSLLREIDTIESATFRLASATDEILDVVLRVGVDFPLLEDYAGYSFTHQNKGITYELEALPEDVFSIFTNLAARQGTAA
jgi:hypothetical protein